MWRGVSQSRETPFHKVLASSVWNSGGKPGNRHPSKGRLSHFHWLGEKSRPKLELPVVLAARGRCLRRLRRQRRAWRRRLAYLLADGYFNWPATFGFCCLGRPQEDRCRHGNNSSFGFPRKCQTILQVVPVNR